MKNLTDLAEWKSLLNHHQLLSKQVMRDDFAQDPERFSRFSITSSGIFLDYSRNRINENTLPLLADLAKSAQLPQKIEAFFRGEPINLTERRPALHTALRDSAHSPISVNGENIALSVKSNLEKMRGFVEAVQTETWRGITGKPLKHVVNIGIGGSHLGPLTCIQALKASAVSDLKFHFLSCVDKGPLEEILGEIDPLATLFIVSSKSFSTIETLTNAKTLLDWMSSRYGKEVIHQHFIAITANAEKARAFGIADDHIFPLWDWVGGRYSVWSAIGLPLMLMIGYENYKAFLDGAYAMDNHFREAPLLQNMPVILGLLGIWYTNFFSANTNVIAPYSHYLRYLTPYLQQAEMESNGKRTNLHGHLIPYQTSPVIFGESGCNGQHSYHQLLHQGQHFIPVDFILVGNQSPDIHHDILMASGLSQAQALMRGKTMEEAYEELISLNYSTEEARNLAPHQTLPGNRPSNVLFLDRMSPHHLGALLALYEHKIFVQGAIWSINSFDQWGVELGKQLLPAILKSVQGKTDKPIDTATAGFIDYVKKAMYAKN